MMLFNNYFSGSVTTSGEKFKLSCQDAGLNYVAFPHPLKSSTGDSLETLITVIGPVYAENVALFITGTHGIEGYAGAGVITGCLSEGVFNHLPDNTAVMLIHMINPWGCAWGHRMNEDNADIFRDVLYYQPELYVDDHRFTEVLAIAAGPTAWEGPEREHSDRLLEQLKTEIGVDQIINIARAGQHRFPKSQCYNGGGISWSNKLYRQLCQQYLSHAKRVFCVDIHTGFGEFGEGILIPYYYESDTEQKKLARLINTYGADAVQPAGFAPDIPRHPRMPWETAEDFLPNLEMTCTGLEFGTYNYSIDESIEFNRYMNYLINYGDLANPERPDLYNKYQQQFYPTDAAWRERVFIRGKEVVQQTLAGLQLWSEEGSYDQ